MSGDALAVELAWGVAGAHSLAADCDVIVVVDVLSFTTAVSVAVSRGATVRPIGLDEQVSDFKVGDVLAGPREQPGPSLSPVSLRELRPGQRLILPSPNGAAISAALVDASVVVAGSLRNTSSVSAWVREHGGRVGIVAAGETDDMGGWRPSFEDAVGAGSVAAALGGRCSPQAAAAALAFQQAAAQLDDALRGCRSGVELVERGFADDVTAASELDADDVVPILRDRVFVAGP